MKHFYEIKKKLSMLLFVGILVLCLAFILINCGKGPQSKIFHPDSGQYAIDCTQAPSGAGCVIFVVSSEFLNRQGPEVTVEAWVKRKTATLNGAVFSRHNAEGVEMWVKDNEPKFAIRRLVAGTSSDFIVESNVTLAENTWYHLAGVLVNAVHSHPSSTSCTPTVMAETPHMDIYVDGEFKNCASTGSRSMADLSTCPIDSFGIPTIGTGSCEGDTLAVGGFLGTSPEADVGTLTGVIDEVKFYTTARTQSLIQQCMDTELGLSGNCSRDSITLGAYMRFNEGNGSAPSDWTGLGAGSKEDAGVSAEDPARAWDGGWVNGAPITKKD